jgi:hypothetical protein
MMTLESSVIEVSSLLMTLESIFMIVTGFFYTGYRYLFQLFYFFENHKSAHNSTTTNLEKN